MAHYEFEALHPFIDGNGRIGRLLIVLHLNRAGVVHAPSDGDAQRCPGSAEGRDSTLPPTLGFGETPCRRGSVPTDLHHSTGGARSWNLIRSGSDVGGFARGAWRPSPVGTLRSEPSFLCAQGLS